MELFFILMGFCFATLAVGLFIYRLSQGHRFWSSFKEMVVNVFDAIV